MKLLLDSGSLCDKASIDFLAEKKNQNLGLFQQLREHNVETRCIKHFRELAIRTNVEWDNVFNDTSAPGLNKFLSGIDILKAFFSAVHFGQLEMTKRLAPIVKDREGRGINVTTERDRTALHIACLQDHPEIVQALIEEGADLDISDLTGTTALKLAAGSTNPDCAATLLCNGADLRPTDEAGLTALHEAAEHETIRMLDTLMEFSVENPARPYMKTHDGQTLLHCAALGGSVKVIEQVLNSSEEASVHERDQYGATCLYWAASTGSLPAVNYFLDLGLVVDEKDHHGATPVLVTIESTNDSAEMIRLLHSRGAGLNAGLRSGILLFYQIDACQKHGNQNMLDCFHYLLEKTIDINYTDSGVNNALHRLCMAIPDRSSACTEQMLIILLKTWMQYDHV